MAFINYLSNNGGTMDASKITLVTGVYQETFFCAESYATKNKYDVYLDNGQKITLTEGVDATRKEFVDYWMAPGHHHMGRCDVPENT